MLFVLLDPKSQLHCSAAVLCSGCWYICGCSLTPKNDQCLAFAFQSAFALLFWQNSFAYFHCCEKTLLLQELRNFSSCSASRFHFLPLVHFLRSFILCSLLCLGTTALLLFWNEDTGWHHCTAPVFNKTRDMFSSDWKSLQVALDSVRSKSI